MSKTQNLLALILLLAIHLCNASRTKINNSCTSSCGNIHKISYPFRLQTDPQNCGNINYILSCENNRTVLYLESLKYYVQAINYNNFTIRLVDANVQKDNCSSIPRRSLSKYELSPYRDYFYLDIYSFQDLFESLVFVSCTRLVNSSHYVDTYPCMTNNSDQRFYYVIVDPYASDIVDSCRIETMSFTSLNLIDLDNISYANIHDSMAFGFEVSWIHGCCEERILCGQDGDTVKMFCGFGTWLDYFYVIIQIPIKILSYFISHLPPSFVSHLPPTFLSYGSTFLCFLLSIFVVYHIVLFTCGAPCVFFFLVFKWRRRHLSMYHNIEEFLQSHEDLIPVRYSYSDIRKITKGFKDKLGEGGYGLIYKGKLRSGRVAAIKVLNKGKANGQEFINEVTSIGRIHHTNIVHLIGFCLEGSKRALVYEFMSNGSLDKYLFSQEGHIAISNEKMYEISIGVARGIEYLHQGCDMQILHFDIKPHNILLDEKFNPKVSDFRLAKLYSTDNSIVSLTAAKGTMGYMAPELFYKNIGGISYKADVYSFGMLLLEMVGRRKNLNAFIENSSQIYFPTWVHDQLISKGIDEQLLEETNEDEKEIMKKMVMVGLWCIQFRPSDRPSMYKVLQMLEGDVEALEMPPKPFLSPEEHIS